MGAHADLGVVMTSVDRRVVVEQVVIAVTGVLAGLAYLGVQLEYRRRTYDPDQLNRGSRCPTPAA